MIIGDALACFFSINKQCYKSRAITDCLCKLCVWISKLVMSYSFRSCQPNVFVVLINLYM